MDLMMNGREVAEAHVNAWNYRLSFINTMFLNCAIELGIPDVLHKHGQSMSRSQLVAALQLHPSKSDALRRLMRVLVHSGFLAQQDNGTIISTEKEEEEHEEEDPLMYSLPASSYLYLKDAPFSLVPVTLLNIDPIPLTSFSSLSAWFRSTERNPDETAHEKSSWEGFALNPPRMKCFHDAMAINSQLLASIAVKECKQVFERLGSLVDVGGSRGIMARAIAEAFPGIKCTVLDLPRVVADLQGTSTLCFLGGDMFQGIPSADAVLLKYVLHNWNDEQSLQILNRCKEAIQNRKEGKVIIIDKVLGSNKGDKKYTESQLFNDILMMTIHNGKERTEKEWKRLFTATGFSNYKITFLPGLLDSLIEAYP